MRWLAHLPEATNLALTDLERAADLDAALAIAKRAGSRPRISWLPTRPGRIGWTIMGRLPIRAGYDPDEPASWAGGAGWSGWLEPERYPAVVDPPSGLIWTANARVVDGEMMDRIGRDHYEMGARAHQIRDRLRSLDAADEADMLAIQLDDSALFLERWRRLLLEVLARDGGVRAALGAVVESWDGRARPESVGYRMVVRFREAVRDDVLPSVIQGCGGLGPGFLFRGSLQYEGPLWRIVESRPAHLLGRHHASLGCPSGRRGRYGVARLRGYPARGVRVGRDRDSRHRSSVEPGGAGARAMARHAETPAAGRRPSCPGCGAAPPARRSGSRCPRAPSRRAISTCRAVRAVTPCRGSIAPATRPGSRARRLRSCPDLRRIVWS